MSRGGTLTLTAAGIRVVSGGSNIAKVSFYRDANKNGTLEVGTDTLLGTDTDGSNGWNLAVSIPSNFKVGTYTYFAQAKDSANVAGNVVSTTNTVSGGRTAAMVVTRDSGPAAIDRVIASHFTDEREERFELLSRLHLSRDLLSQWRHARRH